MTEANYELRLFEQLEPLALPEHTKDQLRKWVARGIQVAPTCLEPGQLLDELLGPAIDELARAVKEEFATAVSNPDITSFRGVRTYFADQMFAMRICPLWPFC